MTVIATTRDSPYVGLVPFEAADEDVFFGRDDDIRLIAANLYAAPLTLLYGPTGVGKTSVLQAGVMARLQAAEGVEPILFSSWQGRGDAARKLRDLITAVDPEAATGAETMIDALARIIERRRVRVMLILDQFEEYSLYHRRGDPLDGELAELMTRPQLPVSVLLSMREDGLAALDRFEDSIPRLFDNYLRFDHLSRAGAEAAIEEPLKRFHTLEGEAVTPARGLTEAVLAEVSAARRERLSPHEHHRDDRYEAPYLQLIMSRLWRARDPGDTKLRPTSLRRLGGVAGILRLQLTEALGDLTPDEQSRASTLFRYLVTPSGSKVAYTLHDLAEYTGLRESAIKALLEELVARHRWLLRAIASPDGRPEHARYELVHDLLAEPVAAWRVDYLSTLEEGERLVQQGTTLAEVVRARVDRDREKAETGIVRPETEARYRAHLGAFETRFGTLERTYWPAAGGAVALVRTKRGALSLQFVSLGQAQDSRTRRLLMQADATAEAAPKLLTRDEADTIVRSLAGIVAGVLELRPQDPGDEARLDTATAELAEIDLQFRSARERSVGYAYMRGILVGLAGVVVLAGIVTGVAVLAGAEPRYDHQAWRELAAALAGAFGGAISAIQRLTARREIVTSQPALPLRTQWILGGLRAVTGAILGVAAALLVESGLIPLDASTTATTVAVAFLAGFGERFVADTFTTAETPSEEHG